MFGLFDSETLVKRISGDSDFEWKGVKYPAIWVRRSTPEEKTAIGMRELPPEPTWDERFYWGVGNPKQLDDVTETPEGATEAITTKGLKSQWIAQVKDTAGKMLAQTDWMVVRQVERQVAVPADVATKRLAIVAECGRLETAISGCATVEELISVVGTQNWGE